MLFGAVLMRLNGAERANGYIEAPGRIARISIAAGNGCISIQRSSAVGLEYNQIAVASVGQVAFQRYDAEDFASIW